ncbi:DUF3606 domain-containing protein [Mucilaginibacter sp. RS28]|uniref:DUF3606 domain-containing protein n=1 Tax=Mucilaginibacter straminoryzae TaxID=2932774 RepID=A0A9X2BDH0_9SPHI|nr:DUF3606 domain-containing protein [Mucilaginibacter straminoryzae]MCJ8212072.1 DUF3606 domain-containing protein [Mucilaginibacter straminoryzae]
MNRRFRISTPDERTIDINDEYAMEMWSRELNVTTAKLKAAIQLVGTAVDAVRKQLNRPSSSAS